MISQANMKPKKGEKSCSNWLQINGMYELPDKEIYKIILKKLIEMPDNIDN